jgi:hypothetical protein
MHNTFGPPAKFVFTQASKLTEESNADEPAVGDHYAIVERLTPSGVAVARCWLAGWLV